MSVQQIQAVRERHVAKHIHGAGAENGTKKATQEIGTEQRISTSIERLSTANMLAVPSEFPASVSAVDLSREPNKVLCLVEVFGSCSTVGIYLQWYRYDMGAATASCTSLLYC